MRRRLDDPRYDDKRALWKSAQDVLIKEVSSFVNQYGLPHLYSNGYGPERHLIFRQGEPIRFTSSGMNKTSGSEDGVTANGTQGSTRGNARSLHHEELLSYAKVFSTAQCFQKTRKQLAAHAKRFAQSNLEGLAHLDNWDLEQACKGAFDAFTEEQRSVLENGGYYVLDQRRFYNLGLLFKDAIDLYLASKGDEAAFNRVLGKMHMEIFTLENRVILEQDSYPARIAWPCAERFTLWFESCGYDDSTYYSLYDRSYETDVEGRTIKLFRRHLPNEYNEIYGSGRIVNVLCEPGEIPESFREVVRNHLDDILELLINEELSNDCFGHQADPAPINPAKPIIRVNDCNTDLVRTLWGVLKGIHSGDIPASIGRCRNCGRLINRTHQRGHERFFCNSSCKGLYAKRTAKSNEGRPNEEIELWQQFLAFLESERAVHIGMESHWCSDFDVYLRPPWVEYDDEEEEQAMAPAEEERRSMLLRFLERMAQKKD